MAGMDWFRWHHGSVNDPKFQLVAKRSGASPAEVIAVWACLLEAASMAEERGMVGEPDWEAMELALGLADGLMPKIVEAMRARSLLTGEERRVTAWEKRQPKRERDDDNSTARVVALRQRKRHETPSNANDNQETPRGEERREEEKTSTSVDVAPTLAGEACKAMKAKGLADVSPSHPKLIALLEAGIKVDELAGAAEDAVKKKKPFAYALATAEGRRRDSVVEALPSAEKAVDPDSQPAVEAEGVRLGIGKWSQLEHWHVYLARVRAAQRSQPPSPGVH
jgi:hypothetical protein